MSEKGMSKDALKQFYFSGSSNYTSFNKVRENKETRTGSPVATAAGSAGNQTPAPTEAHQQSQLTATGSPNGTSVLPEVPVAGVGYNVVKTKALDAKKKKERAAPVQPLGGQTASQEYLAFIRQQQELQQHHNQMETEVLELQNSRRSHQSQLAKLRRQANEVLGQIESVADWNLHSKYNVQELIRDCALSLQPVELIPLDEQPVITALKQLSGHLSTFSGQQKENEMFQPYQLVVDQALRRLERLTNLLESSNVDVTPIVRVSDMFTVQLSNVVTLPTVESLVTSFEEELEMLLFKVESMKEQREKAKEEGEMLVDEKLCYNIIELHERMLAIVIQKAAVLEEAVQQTKVHDNVCSNYLQKANDEYAKVTTRCKKLKGMCEDDTKKIFGLLEKVEEVERNTANKVSDTLVKSDAVLTENSKKMEAVFAKMDALEKEVEVLERERHSEIKRRLDELHKDHHRRCEFTKFVEVVKDHAKHLETTIRGMDDLLHTVDILSEVSVNGSQTLASDFVERTKILNEVKLEGHKQHVEVFRNMLLELGEIVYKKERRIEENDKSIRNAHVQLELMADTFNPNAKKYSDVKKTLLAERDDIEQDIVELKQRAASALQGFHGTEEYLGDKGVKYVHPIAVQEHQALAFKAKALELKALSVGHVEGNAILAELTDVKHRLISEQQEIDALNEETQGKMNSALMLVKAAKKLKK